MVVNFKYSLIEDLRILSRIYRKPKDYTSLRSVIWNPLVIIPFAINNKKTVKQIKQGWDSVTVPNNKITKVITCFVTSIGPEGMFDPKKNVIHARYYKSEGWNEFVETVFHEAAHIEIFDPKKYSYEEDEKKVEKFLDEISQDFCVGQAVSVCHD